MLQRVQALAPALTRWERSPWRLTVAFAATRFLGTARRIYWGLPDPAGTGGMEEERLRAFRGVRDELRQRLAVVFGP